MKKTIIVAVSGGPDSMALLDILHKKDYNCLVAHVNYGVRDSAYRDQAIVENYCKQAGLKFLLHQPEQVKEGNFQAVAREIRYNYFIALAKQYKTDDVYVAHHQDDVLETYIMQKRRNITPEYFGIKEKIKYKSINIVRPLLNYSKVELINYCKENSIEYGIDESNLEDDYKRNKIRHEIVNKMSKEDKELMLEEIKERNDDLREVQKQTKALFDNFKEKYKIDDIISLKKSQAVNVLRLWFKKKKIFNISDSEYFNILKFLQANGKNEYKLNEDFTIFKDYDKISLKSNLDYIYSYVFDEIVFEDYKYFSIKKEGTSFEAVTIKDSDFPLTIRNFQEGDTITMKYGSKRVSRWFIDNKIDPSKRRSWPIVLNKNNEVILVPGIGCNLTHYSNNPNMFVVI